MANITGTTSLAFLKLTFTNRPELSIGIEDMTVVGINLSLQSPPAKLVRVGFGAQRVLDPAILVSLSCDIVKGTNLHNRFFEAMFNDCDLGDGTLTSVVQTQNKIQITGLTLTNIDDPNGPDTVNAPLTIVGVIDVNKARLFGITR